MTDITWLVENIDRITGFFILALAVIAFIRGELIPKSRLQDHKDLIALLRQENAELRETVKLLNVPLASMAEGQKETNRILAELVERDQPRRAGRAT